MASRAQNERKFKHWEGLPATLSGALLDARATSKKSMQTRRRLDSLRKSMTPPVALPPCMKNFPSI
jgi:hypothetical protein